MCVIDIFFLDTWTFFFDQAKAEKKYFLYKEAVLILEERKKKRTESGRRCK